MPELADNEDILFSTIRLVTRIRRVAKVITVILVGIESFKNAV